MIDEERAIFTTATSGMSLRIIDSDSDSDSDSDDTDNIATDEISFVDKHLEGDYDGNDDKRNDENGNGNLSLSLCNKTTEYHIPVQPATVWEDEDENENETTDIDTDTQYSEENFDVVLINKFPLSSIKKITAMNHFHLRQYTGSDTIESSTTWCKIYHLANNSGAE